MYWRSRSSLCFAASKVLTEDTEAARDSSTSSSSSGLDWSCWPWWPLCRTFLNLNLTAVCVSKVNSFNSAKYLGRTSFLTKKVSGSCLFGSASSDTDCILFRNKRLNMFSSISVLRVKSLIALTKLLIRDENSKSRLASFKSSSPSSSPSDIESVSCSSSKLIVSLSSSKEVALTLKDIQVKLNFKASKEYQINGSLEVPVASQ